MIYTKITILVLSCFFSWYSLADSLVDIHILNSKKQAIITLNFDSHSAHKIFLLQNPDRAVLDIHKSGIIQGMPVNFSGNNLVKCVRTSKPKDTKSIRLVFDLTHPTTMRTITQCNGGIHKVVFVITSRYNDNDIADPALIGAKTDYHLNQIISKNNLFKIKKRENAMESNKNNTIRSSYYNPNHAVIIAIDSGHGGQDPGAIGLNGLKEKNVTIAIARKLKILLDNDPMFKGVLTRDGDYFISVAGRSEMARKQNANLLVSIHADAATNRCARGASVWVLSTRRAKSEMINWLERYEKQSELLGGAGDLLANNRMDPYLSQAVLDLQFDYSQRVGYDVAVKIIQQLKQVGVLHKRKPEHASLGVLRSPDIPSLLIETGFISNPLEERLLGSNIYQEKIARSIYRGLRSHFLINPTQSSIN